MASPYLFQKQDNAVLNAAFDQNQKTNRGRME